MNKNRINLGLTVGLLVSLVFMGGCYATTPEGTTTFDWSATLQSVGLLVLIIVVFYFFLMRPQRKRQKEHEKLMEELRKGDRVITAGGIYGQIESVSEDSIVIKVESGATLRVARGSIGGKIER